MAEKNNYIDLTKSKSKNGGSKTSSKSSPKTPSKEIGKAERKEEKKALTGKLKFSSIIGKFKDPQNSMLIKVIVIFGLILLVIGLILLFLKLSYLVYLNIPGEPENLNPEIEDTLQLNQSSGSVYQFYPNMKFNHKDISYKIDSNCDSEKRVRMIKALDDLINLTGGLIDFHLTTGEEPDIGVICSTGERYTPLEETRFFIAGEGGAREVIQTERYNIISSGVILLYGNVHNSPVCNWPNVELHELLHVFGFNHSQSPNSLMYPYLNSCNQKLDGSVVNELKKLYLEPNLPDLYFENISAVKKGRYLDFNMTIKNSGSVDATNVSFSVLDDGKLVETKTLKNIRFGMGIVMEVSNLKLLKRDSDEIDIIIDYGNLINEIDKKNNIAKIKF